jgi:hypothetical protein
MAQHDYIIANQSGAAFRSDLNNGLAAIVSQNSGAAQPSTTYAYQWWADTTTGLLKLRNAANNAWITIGTLADANLGLLSLAGGTLTGALLADDSGTAALPAIAFDGDTNTGIFRAGADQFGIATNGVERVEFGTTEVVFNDGGADVDFRVEGDTKANLLLVDAGADTVSIDGTQQLANQTPLRFGDSDNSHYVALRSPATVAANVTWDLPATDGTASQAITTNGSSVLGWSTVLTQGTAITAGTVSGPHPLSPAESSIDFTGIPSWAKRVTVMLNGVSTNGTSPVIVQLGDSGGVENTGYVSQAAGVSTAAIDTTRSGTNTDGFRLAINVHAATDAITGKIDIVNISSNTWIAQGIIIASATFPTMTVGSKTTSATLDRVRITTVGGTDTFDAGSINILYEG